MQQKIVRTNRERSCAHCLVDKLMPKDAQHGWPRQRSWWCEPCEGGTARIPEPRAPESKTAPGLAALAAVQKSKFDSFFLETVTRDANRAFLPIFLTAMAKSTDDPVKALTEEQIAEFKEVRVRATNRPFPCLACWSMHLSAVTAAGRCTFKTTVLGTSRRIDFFHTLHFVRIPGVFPFRQGW